MAASSQYKKGRACRRRLCRRIVFQGAKKGSESSMPIFIVPPLAGGRWCRRHQKGGDVASGPEETRLTPRVV